MRELLSIFCQLLIIESVMVFLLKLALVSVFYRVIGGFLNKQRGLVRICCIFWLYNQGVAKEVRASAFLKLLISM